MSRTTPVQKRSIETRNAILAAAQLEILTQGRDHFTTDGIAKRAGVSIGTVYNYFADRVDILDELYPQRTEGLGPMNQDHWEVISHAH
jgi:AcrR family transcriptional regulator